MLTKVDFLNSFSPELQLKNIEPAIKNILIDLLSESKGFKFVATLVIEFKKAESDYATKYTTFYSNSKAETIIKKSHILDESIPQLYETYKNILEKIWPFSVVSPTVNISKYNLLGGSSCINYQKELDHPKNCLINIQNIIDNECFKWCLVRYSHPADHHPARTRQVDKLYGGKLDFKDIKFPLKVRDIHKIEKKNSISISVFGYKNKKK